MNKVHNKETCNSQIQNECCQWVLKCFKNILLCMNSKLHTMQWYYLIYEEKY